jgi:hypothetical protein
MPPLRTSQRPRKAGKVKRQTLSPHPNHISQIQRELTDVLRHRRSAVPTAAFGSFLALGDIVVVGVVGFVAWQFDRDGGGETCGKISRYI